MKTAEAGKTRRKTVKFYLGIAILTLAVMIGGSVPYLLIRGGWGNDAGQQRAKYAPRPARAEERRGVWVAYLSLEGVDKAGIDKIVADTKAAGLNTIFFHVRPFGDALYDSQYYPWSHLVTGEQGKAPADGFDPLAYAVEAAHREGIALHAWLNPLRIMLNNAQYPPVLSADNPYTVWRGDGDPSNDDWVIDYKKGKYYNPAIPEVQELIVNGTREIAANYNVDGIHWDDYFYPAEDTSFDDSKAYQAYTAAGGKLSLLDWRTQNISALVRAVYSAVKDADSTCEFGISPAGVVENCLAAGADVVTWGSTPGYVDYLMPQVYWTSDNTIAPFEPVCRRWRQLVTCDSVELDVGLALYKAGSDTDRGKWQRADDIMKQQVLFLRGDEMRAGGFSLYSYAYLDCEQTAAEMAHLKEIL